MVSHSDRYGALGGGGSFKLVSLEEYAEAVTMKEPDLFRAAQEADKDGAVVPWLRELYETQPDTASFLRGYITSMQHQIEALRDVLPKFYQDLARSVKSSSDIEKE